MIVRELEDVFAETHDQGWDGFGAFPTHLDSLDLARRFIKVLHEYSIEPSVGAEPDGSLTLEWYRGRRRSLSISFSKHETIHFAILDGQYSDCGTEVFRGVIPETIRRHIERIAGPSAGLRTT